MIGLGFIQDCCKLGFPWMRSLSSTLMNFLVEEREGFGGSKAFFGEDVGNGSFT